jgi:indole-3-glycerol phosphate synthase
LDGEAVVKFLREIIAEVALAIRHPMYLAGLPEKPPRPPPSFRDAIEAHRSRGALVVEHKRVSPGAADPVLPRRSIAEFVRSVEPADPAAYSCLATGPRFLGSPQEVAELVARTSRPVLFKDFVIDPIQLDAARRAGASAVLLIARLELEHLSRFSMAELSREARGRGLEVLLEVHSPSELALASETRSEVYGVNVRDLDTLKLEPATALATLGAAQSFRPLLGLSGVQSPAEAEQFWRAGADGLLVGSAVARAPDPAAFLRTLYRSMSGRTS